MTLPNYLLPDMDRLSDAFRLIYYAQRGRGVSGGNVLPDAVSLQSEIDDVEGVRAFFQMERAFPNSRNRRFPTVSSALRRMGGCSRSNHKR